eukprot:TRINITY_DN755_c0_g1_i3.p1 TRINITY_DN755_c0_g1~~TRINITY_DN755_c0_g1_i3.p1  ORF type:complete len:387 (+),score=119.36 TRINITY_DN755_c0_g1_i3:122-1162(+)
MPAPDLEKGVSGKERLPEKKGSKLQLLWGVGGIYSCFIYFGSVQEDVFKYKSPDGTKFTQVWLLLMLEAVANVIVGFVGLMLTHRTIGLPQDMFAMTGATQVTAKYCTNAALAYGLSFPVATLAKSGKLIPVMVGSLFIGGESYSLRQYLQVAMIVVGTCIVSLGGGKKKTAENTVAGVLFIVGSLTCDGLTGGVQRRLKRVCAGKGLQPKAYDFMFWTNLYMAVVAFIMSVLMSELLPGLAFIFSNNQVMWLALKFSVLSAFGQSFIFYTIAVFDPLVTTTVTTTRKIFSILYSVIFKGNQLSPIGWLGMATACTGILGDVAQLGDKKKEATSPPPPPVQQSQQV